MNRRASSHGRPTDGRQYRVRWLGLPPTSNLWEPRSILFVDAPDVVKAYDAEANMVVLAVEDLQTASVGVNHVPIKAVHDRADVHAQNSREHVHGALPTGAPLPSFDIAQELTSTRSGLELAHRDKIDIPRAFARSSTVVQRPTTMGTPSHASRQAHTSGAFPPDAVVIRRSMTPSSSVERMQSMIHQASFDSRLGSKRQICMWLVNVDGPPCISGCGLMIRLVSR